MEQSDLAWKFLVDFFFAELCRGSVPSASFWKNPGMNSSGFCLLNNAAIGAAYARCRCVGKFKCRAYRVRSRPKTIQTSQKEKINGTSKRGKGEGFGLGSKLEVGTLILGFVQVLLRGFMLIRT